MSQWHAHHFIIHHFWGLEVSRTWTRTCRWPATEHRWCWWQNEKKHSDENCHCGICHIPDVLVTMGSYSIFSTLLIPSISISHSYDLVKMQQSKWKLWKHNVTHTQLLSWTCVWPSQPQIRDRGWTTGPQVEWREPTHWTLHMSWVPAAGAVLVSHYMPRSLSLSSLPCNPMSSWSWWKEGKKKQVHDRRTVWLSCTS